MKNKTKNKIIKIIERYIFEFPNTPIEKRTGGHTWELLLKIKKEIENI